MIYHLKQILNYSIYSYKGVKITILTILILIIVFIITNSVMNWIKRIVTKNLSLDDRSKFVSVFHFIKFLVYFAVIIITLSNLGIDVSVLLTASAALMIGLGFALQQLFQDIIAGIIILLDKSLKVGDVIELEGKICIVENIKLRTTIAITRDERVMVIPNHKFLQNTIFNWTQNHKIIRESVQVRVPFESDAQFIEKILLEVALEHEDISKSPRPIVFLDNFGESSLEFILHFYLSHAFSAPRTLSEIRFAIDKKFKEHKIKIPFTQRDIHLYNKN